MILALNAAAERLLSVALEHHELVEARASTAKTPCDVANRDPTGVSVSAIAYNVQKGEGVVSKVKRTSLGSIRSVVLAMFSALEFMGVALPTLISAAHSATVFELLDDLVLNIYRSKTVG